MYIFYLFKWNNLNFCIPHLKSNILLDDDKIKIGDLGSAIDMKRDQLKTEIGTTTYKSPEMLEFLDGGKDVTLKTDIW